ILGTSNAALPFKRRVTVKRGSAISCPGIAYTPQQIASAYDWPSITDPANGAGITIAVATAASIGFTEQEAQHFWSHFGLPSHTVTPHFVGTPTGSSGLSETTLDVEWAGAMAPGANIDVYVGQNSLLGFYETYHEIIDNSQHAQVLTTSWGT